MSGSRRQSDASIKTPHSVSLKVLRLTRPSLHTQHTLPEQSGDASIKVNTSAALSSSSSEADKTFTISPLLTLPASFGSTYNGETFTFSLCINNELPHDDPRMLTDVNIVVEIQTPSRPKATPLDLVDESSTNVPSPLEAGGTLQRIVRYELREEGNHMLCVTVTYLEDGKLRTFRKLYQFLSRQLLKVAVKSRVLPKRGASLPVYALEAQLENLSDVAVVLQDVSINAKPYIQVKSLNAWDIAELDTPLEKPLLAPRDVIQVAYLLSETAEAVKSPDFKETRLDLAQLQVAWRGNMGEEGKLSTGWLSARRR